MAGRSILPINWEDIVVPSTVITCPHCRVPTHYTPMTHSWDGEKKAWVIQKCDNCRRLALTIFNATSSVVAYPDRGNIPELDQSPEDVYPYFSPIPDPSIPKEIAEDYAQAVVCYSAGAYGASAVMSRRAIETTAISLGAKPNKLIEMIKYLGSKGLEQSLIDLATEIRLLGNVPGAHPDKYNLLRRVTRDECKAVLDFLEAFLDSLYIRPAKIQKLKSARTSKSP